MITESETIAEYIYIYILWYTVTSLLNKLCLCRPTKSGGCAMCIPQTPERNVKVIITSIKNIVLAEMLGRYS